MKTAIYIEDGLTQVVLTPEGKWEEAMVKRISEVQSEVRVVSGVFVHTHGEYVRWGDESPRSLMVVLREKETAPHE